jgi:YVTN family beta-propeller protein
MRVTVLLMIGCALALQSVMAAEEDYKFLNEIPIGGEGGWDILTVDSAARRLYLSHATKIIVVDLAQNAIAGEIADTPGVHGFVAVPELQRGFSSNGKEAKSSVVDLKTLSTISKIDTGENPDALVYEPRRGEVYIFNHTGRSATVIDAKTAKVISTIPLGGSPEFAVADSAAGRVYCNLEDKNEVVMIDVAKHEVVAHWPLAPGEEPTGIALDAAHHRLFVTCHNKVMEMLDTTTGKCWRRCRSAPGSMVALSMMRHNSSSHHAVKARRRSQKRKHRTNFPSCRRSRPNAARARWRSIRKRIGFICPPHNSNRRHRLRRAHRRRGRRSSQTR